MSGVHGVLVIDKPLGPTSHDIVARARRVYGTRQVGHAGTLDPTASGVLVLLFGEACKLAAYLTSSDKTYRASVVFGKSTDTLDAAGRALEERALEPGWLTRDAIERALETERARLAQLPPEISAIKVAGERAHRAARRGSPLELAPRGIRVLGLTLEAWSDAELEAELEVSKGYYVRAFARDLGQTLGVPAHLGALRRTRSGCFSLAEAAAWPLETPHPLLPLAAAARRALPPAELTPEGTERARKGQVMALAHFVRAPPEGVSAWFGPDDVLVAVGECAGTSRLVVIRGFNAC